MAKLRDKLGSLFTKKKEEIDDRKDDKKDDKKD
jgi:hypothetical protein